MILPVFEERGLQRPLVSLMCLEVGESCLWTSLVVKPAIISRWWVIGGLGARGLVYHAWLGELMAQAVLNDNEAHLPHELMRWKSCDIKH